MTERSIAFLFPGQGSQAVGMGQDFSNAFPFVKELFNQADEILEFSISKISWEGPENLLNDTIYTQPALLVNSIGILCVIEKKYPNITPKFLAGHSMGELTTLIVSKSSSISDVIKLTQTRGRLMKLAGERSPGKMAAILGLGINDVEEICTEVTHRVGIVQVANDNCPGQIVISGTSSAVESATDLAKSAGAKKVQELAVSIPAHSPLMASVQEEYNQAVDSTSIGTPKTLIIGNVSASTLENDTNIRLDLKQQLTSKVRWTESINYMIDQGIDTFIEIGNKSVLTSLLKRIDKSVEGLSISTIDDLEKLEHL